jgi:hypothetical protein
MQAARRFDPEGGFRLPSYALWWIRTAIQEYALRLWSPRRALRCHMRVGGPYAAPPLDIEQLISHWVSRQTVEAHSQDDGAEAQRHATPDGLPVDTVDLSVFSTRRVLPGAKFFVQAFVHDHKELVEAARLASRLAKSANRRGFATLQTRVGSGAAIDFLLESADLLDP